MLDALALLLAADQAALPPLPDLQALAPLRYMHDPEMKPAMTQFVADEVAAGRCAKPQPVAGHYRISFDVAVLVDGDGMVRATVPHAIDCPTVEQYGAGLVSSFARDNLVSRAPAGPQWFHTSLTFDWAQ